MQVFADRSLIDESDSGRARVFRFAFMDVPKLFRIVLQTHAKYEKNQNKTIKCK